jgi:hypothetical protein
MEAQPEIYLQAPNVAFIQGEAPASVCSDELHGFPLLAASLGLTIFQNGGVQPYRFPVESSNSRLGVSLDIHQEPGAAHREQCQVRP